MDVSNVAVRTILFQEGTGMGGIRLQDPIALARHILLQQDFGGMFLRKKHMPLTSELTILCIIFEEKVRMRHRP